MSHSPLVLELTEYIPKDFPKEFISEEEGRLLVKDYSTQVVVEPPSYTTNDRWRLTAQGWVGYIPLTRKLGIAIKPKVTLRNLFGMLEYAYRLESFHFLKGLFESNSLEEFYEQLALILARRVLDRGRKGYYRTYVPRIEHMPYIRGRVVVEDFVKAPWKVNPRNHFAEQTSDVVENEILAWTLLCIIRSGMCTERVLPYVRLAYRNVLSLVTLIPFKPDDCIGRVYNRLNDDYEPMHALCRFFLEHSGPNHEIGDKTMLPFLVNMAQLYQLFVAEWLKGNLPEELEVKVQERVNIGTGGKLYFNIDLVLYDKASESVRIVLDTKYKDDSSATPDDIAKAMAYAESKGCTEAVLIYPTQVRLDERIGRIRVRGLSFLIEHDLERAGQLFMKSIFENLSMTVSRANSDSTVN